MLSIIQDIFTKKQFLLNSVCVQIGIVWVYNDGHEQTIC